MIWNYRLVRVKVENTTDEYSIGIYEVYYDEGMNPTHRTENPCSLWGDTFDDVLGEWAEVEKVFKSDVLSDDLFEVKGD